MHDLLNLHHIGGLQIHTQIKSEPKNYARFT
jgi:hypothetical protein